MRMVLFACFYTFLKLDQKTFYRLKKIMERTKYRYLYVRDEGLQGVGDSKEYSKEELQKDQEDYQKGLDLLNNPFRVHQPNVEDHKSSAKKVMDEALQVMNGTACVALKEGKQGAGKTLTNDYHTYLEKPNAENKEKVAQDIQTLSE